ncbi:MAG: deoxyribonuclease IV [Bacilli bacterium]|nr:deoxyribonuclease IV [Bacilli bacterium]
MLKIGSHVSFTKDTQLIGSINESISYNSNCFMIYTGAPQNTNRSDISKDITNKAHLLLKELKIDLNDVIVHAPYIVNLSNYKDERSRDFAISFLKQEIDRCEQLGLSNLVLHPGSHVGLGEEVGLKNTVDALNIILSKDSKVNILIETMSGKGTEIGYKIDHLKYIIDNVKYNDKIKICLDSCHLNDSGYDISNFDSILDEIDSKIGIDKIKCIHINDSKNNISDKKDRHSNIGFGTLGFDNIINIIYNKRLENIPKILETPYVNGYPPYKFEIEMIKNKEFNPELLENIVNYYKNI